MSRVYSIFDKKTEEWSTPFFQTHDVTALRSFREAVLTDDPNNMLKKYPKDFTLYYIGDWNNETGILKGVGDNAQPLATAEAVMDPDYDPRGKNAST